MSEGDVFVGVRVPALRKVAREFQCLAWEETEQWLHSAVHEHRLAALLISVRQAAKADAQTRKRIYDRYLANTRWVNNWDLCLGPGSGTPAKGCRRRSGWRISGAAGDIEAFDRAVLELGEHHTVVIPTRAKLERKTGGNDIVIEMEKSLGFMGHPTQLIAIDQARRDMGCAWLSKAGELRLATCGEFLSGGAGGRTSELNITIPEGVRVERDDRYEMSRAGDTGAHGSRLRRSSGDGDAWYSPEDSDEKWLPIVDVPDPERAAQHERGR